MRHTLIVAALLFALSPAHADTVYDVSGTATLTGDNSCSGPCIETINFAFQLDEQIVPNDIPGQPGFDAELANNLTVTASGPLGVPQTAGNSAFADDKFLPLFFGPNLQTEFDLGLPFPPPAFPFEPDSIFGDLFSCASASCFGFCPVTGPSCGGTLTMQASIAPVADAPGATFSFRALSIAGGPLVATAPEPGTFALLTSALFGLGLIRRRVA